ncbi:MAG: hypothetical protein ACK5LC_01405 [Coprobacillaceae bacterium]
MVYIFIQEDTSKQLYKKYQVAGDIKGDLIEKIYEYSYINTLSPNHEIKNNSSILEEIDISIVWETWNIPLDEILLNSHVFVQTKGELYIIIGSKDIISIDTEIQEDGVVIDMWGEEMLFYQGFVHVYKIHGMDRYSKIRFNNETILPSYSYDLN